MVVSSSCLIAASGQPNEAGAATLGLVPRSKLSKGKMLLASTWQIDRTKPVDRPWPDEIWTPDSDWTGTIAGAGGVYFGSNKGKKACETLTYIHHHAFENDLWS